MMANSWSNLSWNEIRDVQQKLMSCAFSLTRTYCNQSSLKISKILTIRIHQSEKWTKIGILSGEKPKVKWQETILKRTRGYKHTSARGPRIESAFLHSCQHLPLEKSPLRQAITLIVQLSVGRCRQSWLLPDKTSSPTKTPSWRKDGSRSVISRVRLVVDTPNAGVSWLRATLSGMTSLYVQIICNCYLFFFCYFRL